MHKINFNLGQVHLHMCSWSKLVTKNTGLPGGSEGIPDLPLKSIEFVADTFIHKLEIHRKWKRKVWIRAWILKRWVFGVKRDVFLASSNFSRHIRVKPVPDDA